MPAPAAYRPHETHEQIFSEHAWLQGAFLAAVAYGMQVILYSMSCYLLAKHRNPTNSTKNVGLTIYITILFLLGTLYVAALLQFTQESFIDGSDIPGGPDAYEKVMFSSPIDMLGNVTMVILTWMCDIINVRHRIFCALKATNANTGMEMYGHLQGLESSCMGSMHDSIHDVLRIDW